MCIGEVAARLWHCQLWMPDVAVGLDVRSAALERILDHGEHEP